MASQVTTATSADKCTQTTVQNIPLPAGRKQSYDLQTFMEKGEKFDETKHVIYADVRSRQRANYDCLISTEIQPILTNLQTEDGILGSRVIRGEGGLRQMFGYYVMKENKSGQAYYKQQKKLDMLTGIEAVNIYQPNICSAIFVNVKTMLYDI